MTINVLVIDDDFAVASVHCGYVTAVPGFNVVGQAHCGADALRAVQELDAVQAAMAGGVVHYLVKPFSLPVPRERLLAYQAHRAELLRRSACHGGLDQGEVDRLVHARHRVRGAAPLPKGLSDRSLGLVADVLRSAARELSSVEVAELCGMSRVSARRYLAHLEALGLALVRPRYGAAGRPVDQYRWAGTTADTRASSWDRLRLGGAASRGFAAQLFGPSWARPGTSAPCVRSPATMSVVAGLVCAVMVLVGSGTGFSAAPRGVGTPCVAVTVDTRTSGSIERLSASRIRVKGSTVYWDPARGWRALPAPAATVVVQKQKADGTWVTVNRVAPRRWWKIAGTAGVYRLAHVRDCTRPYAASSSRAVRIAAAGTKPTPTTPAASGSFADQVVALTNQQRSKSGCPRLAVDPILTSVAQAHSADMAGRDFFDHDNPDGRSPFERLAAAGYAYRLAAENIAAGYPTPAAVVEGWMNSPGHRANVLNCGLTEIGVGYATGGSYRHYWTQVFGTPASASARAGHRAATMGSVRPPVDATVSAPQQG